MSMTDEKKREVALVQAGQVIEAKLNGGASIDDPADAVVSAAEKFYEFLDKAEKPRGGGGFQ